jgi:hypothetical protein
VINWGIDQNLIFEQAKENTKGEINKILFETIDVNEYMKYYVSFDESNYFVNSILLFPELISKYDLNKQGLIIGVPVRHICTIMPVSLTKSIYDDLKNYYSFLIQIYQNEVNPTTLNMFLLKNGDYYPITPLYDEQNNFVKFLAPEILNR